MYSRSVGVYPPRLASLHVIFLSSAPCSFLPPSLSPSFPPSLPPSLSPCTLYIINVHLSISSPHQYSTRVNQVLEAKRRNGWLQDSHKRKLPVTKDNFFPVPLGRNRKEIAQSWFQDLAGNKPLSVLAKKVYTVVDIQAESKNFVGLQFCQYFMFGCTYSTYMYMHCRATKKNSVLDI